MKIQQAVELIKSKIPTASNIETVIRGGECRIKFQDNEIKAGKIQNDSDPSGQRFPGQVSIFFIYDNGDLLSPRITDHQSGNPEPNLHLQRVFEARAQKLKAQRDWAQLVENQTTI